MLELLLLLLVALPIAWFVSEFQQRRWISVVLGFLSLAMIYFGTYAWCSFWTTFNLNVHYGETTKKLLVVTVDALEDGQVDLLKRELGGFVEHYDPNYENSPRYNEQADKLVERLREGMNGDRASAPNNTSRVVAEGDKVQVSGIYNGAGKFGPYIRLGDTQVYLVADQGASWPDFEGQRVTVAGSLRLHPSTAELLKFASTSESGDDEPRAGAPSYLELTTTPESIVADEAEQG